MSLAAWKTLDDDGRRVALDGLLERLPTWLELLEVGPQPRFRDSRHGETWRLFPGGSVTVGLTPEREAAIEALRLRDPLLLFDPTPYLPVREVTVSPFFLMEKPLLEEDGEPRVLVMDAMKAHKALLSEREQRLPTEAEWEFAWHAVQAQPANWMLGTFELVADGWRADLHELEGHDPVVSGAPGVLKTVSVNPLEVESIFPLRQPFSGSRIATIRCALDVPR
jgi:formylglycine-generating enzyme required for sulfatase activity